MICKSRNAAPPPISKTVMRSCFLLFKADQVECCVNNFTPVPTATSIDFNHLATLNFGNGLFGFNYVINNVVKLPLISIKILFLIVN